MFCDHLDLAIEDNEVKEFWCAPVSGPISKRLWVPTDAVVHRDSFWKTTYSPAMQQTDAFLVPHDIFMSAYTQANPVEQGALRMRIYPKDENLWLEALGTFRKAYNYTYSLLLKDVRKCRGSTDKSSRQKLTNE